METADPLVTQVEEVEKLDEAERAEQETWLESSCLCLEGLDHQEKVPKKLASLAQTLWSWAT